MAELTPLIPDILEPTLYRRDSLAQEAADADFAAIRPRVLERDNYTCRGCGIPLPPHPDHGHGLEVHHISGDSSNNAPENLLSLCRLCHGIFHIGHTTKTLGPAVQLLYCPELSQGELNLLSWSMALARYARSQCPQEDPATDAEPEEINAKTLALLFDLLPKRTTFPKRYFAQAAQNERFARILSANTDSRFFAYVLALIRERSPTAYAARKTWLGGLRIFYDPTSALPFHNQAGENCCAHLLAHIQPAAEAPEDLVLGVDDISFLGDEDRY